MTAAKNRAAKSAGGKGLIRNRPAGRTIMKTWRQAAMILPAKAVSRRPFFYSGRRRGPVGRGMRTSIAVPAPRADLILKAPLT